MNTLIERAVPREIKDFKEKVVLGLTMRQLICFGIAIVAAVGTYLLTYEYIGVDSASWLCMVAAAPFAAMALFKKDGLTFEQYVWVMIRFLFLVPQKRPYKTENFFEHIEKQQGEKESKKGVFLKRKNTKGGGA